jgi:hypothetical protein
MHRAFRTLSACLVLAVVFSQAVPAPSFAAPQFVATLAVAPTSYFGKCPALIKIAGTIHNNAPFVSSVNYSILNSDGIDSFQMTANFNAMHVAFITDARTPSIPGGYWVQMRIWVANKIVAVSNKAAFTVECTGVKPTPTPTPCVNANGVPCKPTPTPTPCISTAVPCNPNATPTPKPTPCVSTFAPCNTPTPKPTPCRLPTGAPCPTPTPCPPGVNCKKLPDLTPRPPVTVGGHATTWGAGVSLTDADAFLKSAGHCAFNIKYVYSNIGAAPAIPAPNWKNELLVDGVSLVSLQTITTPLPVAGTSVINTTAYLPGGVHTLTLKLNYTGSLVESNYANNAGTIKYQLVGNCANVITPARLTPR